MTPTDPQTFFLQQGVLGVIIVVLSGFIIWLFSRLDAKDKVIDNRDVIIMGLQEKRVVDFKENSEKIIETSGSLLSGLQSLREAATTQTNVITKVLDGLSGRTK